MTDRAAGRGRGRPILIGAASLLLALALATWGLGGLRAAPATGVRTFTVGTPITLTRWTLVVQKAELADTSTDGYKQQTTIRVWLLATWNQSASTYGLDDGVVDVVVPNGPPVDPDPSTPDVGGYSGGFDPGVTRPLIYDFTWPHQTSGDKPVQAAVPRVPTSVDVVIRDEYLSPNLFTDDDWRRTQPIGYVHVPVRDVRK